MKKLIFILSLLLSLNSFAKPSMQDSDKGNGGSFDEAAIIITQAMFDDTLGKLKNFFIQNKSNLKTVFPEFEIEELIKKFNEAQVEIHGDPFVRKNYFGAHDERICVVLPEQSKLKCHFSYLELNSRFPHSYGILIFELYLKLLGFKGTPTYSYGGEINTISSRLKNYIVKLGSDNLMSEKTTSYGLENSMHLEKVNANFKNESDISEKKLIDNSLNMANKNCKEKGKKVTFSDAHVLNKIPGTVVLRYICD